MSPYSKTLTALLPGLSVLVASCIGFAAAAESPQAATTAHKPKTMDTDKDSQLFREDVKGDPGLEKAFDAIDTNKDGQLSREEIKAYLDAHKAQHKK